MAGTAGGVKRLAAPEGLLRWRAERSGVCVIIHVAGELDYGTADLLRAQAVTEARALPCPLLVLDLGDVGFCDSSGLGALVGIAKAVRAEGGALALAGVTPRCRLLLARTGLAGFLPVWDSVAEAVAAVSARREATT